VSNLDLAEGGVRTRNPVEEQRLDVEEQRRELKLLRAQMDAEATAEAHMAATVVVLGLCVVPGLAWMLTGWTVGALGIAPQVADEWIRAHDNLLGGAAILWVLGVFVTASWVVRR
jgi:hypothetical protein